MKASWTFQEFNVNWTWWGFGFELRRHRGWASDELDIYFGPCTWSFVK